MARRLGIRYVYSVQRTIQSNTPEITKLTGITDEMVAAQKIDGDTLSAFVDDAVIVIAHNASFDRKFAELTGQCFRTRLGLLSFRGALAQTRI